MDRMKAAYEAIKKAQGGHADDEEDASDVEDVKPKLSDVKPQITGKTAKPVKVKAEAQSEGHVKRPVIKKEKSE